MLEPAGSALFSLSAGEELTYLNTGSKPTLGGFGAGNTLSLSPGQEAYIGYWSQRGGKPASSTPASDDIFGWATVTSTIEAVHEQLRAGLAKFAADSKGVASLTAWPWIRNVLS